MQLITHNKHAVNLARPERWASVIAGGGLAILGIRRRTPLGIALAAAGGEMIRRGVTGRSYLYNVLGVHTAPLGQGAETTSIPYQLGIRVDRAVTVEKGRMELFRFWRDLRNLPRFMKHVRSVTVLDEKRSHWVVTAPAGRTVEWDAEIVDEKENEHIGWRSLPNATVDNAGSVWFKDAPGGRGTVVRVELQYNPPAGVLGALVAQMFGEEPGQQIDEDLHRFKQLMEAGEIATTEGQTSASPKALREAERRSREVTEASVASFPASDSPSFTAERSRL
jgi:uncharacterized membrane protein